MPNTKSVPITTDQFTALMHDPDQPQADTHEPFVAEDLPTEPTVTEEQHHHLDYTPDYRTLDACNGNTDVWSNELFQLIGHATGKFIDEGTLKTWLDALAGQIQRRTYRAAAFQVANTTLPDSVAGDPAFLLLQLREDLTARLKTGAV